MITRTEAERVAAAIHCLRPDWPIASLITFIRERAADWALTDLASALAWVAVDQDIDGTPRTVNPGRVLHHGPWRDTGRPEQLAASAQDAAARRDRLELIRLRGDAIRACNWCDEHGRTNEGAVCEHTDPSLRPTLNAPLRAEVRDQLAAVRSRRNGEVSS